MEFWERPLCACPGSGLRNDKRKVSDIIAELGGVGIKFGRPDRDTGPGTNHEPTSTNTGRRLSDRKAMKPPPPNGPTRSHSVPRRWNPNPRGWDVKLFQIPEHGPKVPDQAPIFNISLQGVSNSIAMMSSGRTPSLLRIDEIEAHSFKIDPSISTSDEAPSVTACFSRTLGSKRRPQPLCGLADMSPATCTGATCGEKPKRY